MPGICSACHAERGYCGCYFCNETPLFCHSCNWSNHPKACKQCFFREISNHACTLCDRNRTLCHYCNKKNTWALMYSVGPKVLLGIIANGAEKGKTAKEVNDDLSRFTRRGSSFGLRGRYYSTVSPRFTPTRASKFRHQDEARQIPINYSAISAEGREKTMCDDPVEQRVMANEVLDVIKEKGEFLLVRFYSYCGEEAKFMMHEGYREPFKTREEAEEIAAQITSEERPVVVVQIKSIIARALPPTDIIRLGGVKVIANKRGKR